MKYANFTKEELISKIDVLEKEIFEIKESTETTFNKIVVGIAHVSRKGDFIRVNKMFAQMSGYDAEAMLNMNVDDISYLGEISTTSPEVQKVWKGESDHFSIEKRYVRKDKSSFWGSLTLSHQKSS